MTSKAGIPKTLAVPKEDLAVLNLIAQQRNAAASARFEFGKALGWADLAREGIKMVIAEHGRGEAKKAAGKQLALTADRAKSASKVTVEVPRARRSAPKKKKAPPRPKKKAAKKKATKRGRK